MQLLAAAFLIAFSFALLAVDALFEYPGLAAFGGMLIGLTGTRIIQTGLTKVTDSGGEVAVEFGDVPVGFLVMLVGAIILIMRLHKFREATV